MTRNHSTIDSRLRPAETLADSIADFFNSIPLRLPAQTDAERRLANWRYGPLKRAEGGGS